MVCSPKSGASLWDLSGFEEQYLEAKERALPVLRPLATAAAVKKLKAEAAAAAAAAAAPHY